MANLIANNASLLVGVSGILCGVALLYLVVSRTIKRREESE
jgi:hypothetical protein